MKRIVLVLLMLLAAQSLLAQVSGHVCIPRHATTAERQAADYLLQQLNRVGHYSLCIEGSQPADAPVIHLGNTRASAHLPMVPTPILPDGFRLWSDGKSACVLATDTVGKALHYAVCHLLEMMGYRYLAPDHRIFPDSLVLPVIDTVSNPSFRYREVQYDYPNSDLEYADWHGVHNRADMARQWGMFVHTFQILIPPDTYFDSHPEWFSMIDGKRVRDGQLCLSDSTLLDTLCVHLAERMAANPSATIWSVSNNDNYNVCQCPRCRCLDSLYGGPSGTLIHFINSVARRFPDKTISTLGYQFTRTAPRQDCPFPQRPDSNVNVMFCSIECGRQESVATAPGEASFRRDMENWGALTDNIFLWDYIVQFRNYWNPFPNLHVLQPNLQFFHAHGVNQIFEQGSAPGDITSWMDIRCYLVAKLMWDVDADIDSLVADFCRHRYGGGADAMRQFFAETEQALIASNQHLDIYGYPVDAVNGYLSPDHMASYRALIRQAYDNSDVSLHDNIRLVELSLDFAELDLTMAGSIPLDTLHFLSLAANFAADCRRLGILHTCEMHVSVDNYLAEIDHYLQKIRFPNKAHNRPVHLLHPPAQQYDGGGAQGLTNGKMGIMDYRHDWMGFWGDTLDAVIDLDTLQSVSQVSLDFFFYPLSWIFLPQRVEYYCSDNGNRWEPLGTLSHPNPEILATPAIHTFSLIFPQRCTRYLRIVATPLPSIPEWHRATGNPAWIFTDEILVK